MSTKPVTTKISSNYLQVSENEHNAIVIKNLEKIVSSDEKLALFIGRKSTEELPKETGFKWVSLDIIEENLSAISTDRLHLIADCNEEAHIAKIQHLFSKVVVDQSTWKFFKPEIIERLTLLLLQKTDSTLIFESAFQFISSDPEATEWSYDHVRLVLPQSYYEQYDEEVTNCFEDFLSKIGGIENLKDDLAYKQLINEMDPELVKESSDKELEEDFAEHLAKNILGPTQKCIPLARQKTKEHLETLFEKVELKLNAPYPYTTRYSVGKDDFFIATGPKKV